MSSAVCSVPTLARVGVGEGCQEGEAENMPTVETGHGEPHCTSMDPSCFTVTCNVTILNLHGEVTLPPCCTNGSLYNVALMVHYIMLH